MTTNAENLAKAFILGLDPSILVRNPKEQWFSKCFLSLKLVLSRPIFSLPKMVVVPFYMSRVLCSNKSGLCIFTAVKRDSSCNE